MNPPFANGDLHLLKAIDIQKNGGKIVCILNAETIDNPYSNTRKLLANTLNKYNAEIKYYENAFVGSERTTVVCVAVVYIDIPRKSRR
jgi:hypothetical protein